MMGFDLPFPPSKWMKTGEMEKIQFQSKIESWSGLRSGLVLLPLHTIFEILFSYSIYLFNQST